MATIEQIYEGMLIFMKNGQKGSDVCSEHDKFFGPESDSMVLSEDELKTLDKAGWFVNYDFWQHHC